MTKTKHSASEVRPLAEALVLEFLQAGVVVRAELAGSLRRGTAEVGDIEIVTIPVLEIVEQTDGQLDLYGPAETKKVESSKLWSYLDVKSERKQIAYKKRGNKYRQFMYQDIQVDLFTARRETWGWIHLIRTGSADFSRTVAGALNRRGYTSEAGWIKAQGSDGKRVETPTERDVFRYAGMPWTDPGDRSW